MKAAIYFSFVFLGAYAVSVLFGHYPTAIFFFSASPFVVMYVVYRVLKDPKEVTVTFEDQFYQDGSHPRVKE